jgi:hypothetical protein
MLKCYNRDYAWKSHWDLKYKTSTEALKYINKLLRHFKLNTDVRFCRYSRGFAYHSGKCIELPKQDISLGIIAHEIGHLLAYKFGYKGHTKKAYKYINRVYKYSMKYIPNTERIIK